MPGVPNSVSYWAPSCSVLGRGVLLRRSLRLRFGDSLSFYNHAPEQLTTDFRVEQ